MKTLDGFLLTLLGATALLHADDKAVIVHEWGTFTCLQDEQGHAIGGINTDDEPVPRFVWGAETVRHHELGDFGLPPYNDQVKGWRPADPEVTMRLETPVLYFYPPKGTAAHDVPPLDVYVKFHGGALTQYYPYAVTDGMPPDFPRATPPPIGSLQSGLTWKGVQLGSTAIPVQTDDHVWTTPREVSAPMLTVPSPVDGDGQMHLEPLAEHFLFYRGLGQVDSPISLNQANLDMNQRKDIFPWIHRTFTSSGSFEARPSTNLDSDAWLAEILPNGSCRWEYLPVEFGPSGMRLAGKFVTLDFKPGNLAKLKSSMHAALVKEGLYDDEATAMLKTWELSYFKSPGLRFFYIVPRAWVDKVLPLTITGAPTQVTRVMVGRIELISDAQQQALARLANGPCPDLWALKTAADSAVRKGALSKEDRELYYDGAKPIRDLGVTIQPFVQDYLSLGRFRDALIVHEQQEHPSPALAQFIKENRLAGP